MHVPRSFRIPVIQRLHVGTEVGHTGYKKTLAKLRIRYIWETMAKDVISHYENVHSVLEKCEGQEPKSSFKLIT